MSNLQITFLGTSGSTPTTQRGMPAVAIKYEGDVFLFDCGEGTQRAMMQYGVPYGSLKAMFITHLHLDHFLGAFGLLETLKLTQVSPRKIELFAPANFENLLFNKHDFAQVKEIKKGKLFEGKDFFLSAFPVKHNKDSFGFIFQENEKIKFHEQKAHSLGLKGRMFTEIQNKGHVAVGNKRIALEDVSYIKPGKKIVYTGDCAPNDTLIKAAENADLLIHEATFAEELAEEAKERNHSTAKQAAEVAKKANVKKLILMHISPRYSKGESLEALLKDAKSVFENTVIAEDGMQIPI